jgi:hypothetical protein
MGVSSRLTLAVAVLFICGCSDPPPPSKTVFDPLTSTLKKAHGVQDTIDQNAASTRAAAAAEEQGNAPPPGNESQQGGEPR